MILPDDDHGAGEVVVQVPGALVFQGGGVIDFDLEAGGVDVELFAVAGHAEAEAGPAGELGGLGDAVGAEIEGPKFAALVAVLAGGNHGVGVFAVRRHFQVAHALGGRADRRVIDAAGGQVET